MSYFNRCNENILLIALFIIFYNNNKYICLA